MARCARSGCRTSRLEAFRRLLRLGVEMDGAWFCSPGCVRLEAAGRLIDARPPRAGVPPVPPLRLGVLLLHQGAVSSATLSRALISQRQSGRKLGAELVASGATDVEHVLRGLAAQAGVSYLATVDPACVRHAPGGLSLDEIRALGVVPIQADAADRVLMVACPAPVPRAALAALRQLTGWMPEPYLVSDDTWGRLVAAYGTAPAGDARRVEFTTVRDVDEAAAQIAAAAASQGAVTVTQARSETSTWVRIVGREAISTLLVPSKEEKWQAATTSR